MLKKILFGVCLLTVVLADAIVPRGCAKRPERPLPPPPEPAAVEENAAQKPPQTADAPSRLLPKRVRGDEA